MADRCRRWFSALLVVGVVLLLLIYMDVSQLGIRNIMLAVYSTKQMANRQQSKFQYHWLRMHQARTDWQTLLKPCSDQVAWGTIKKGWGKENRSSAKHSYITFMDIQPAGQFSRIFIQTRNAGGQDKTIGGDFWRVYFTGPANVSAMIFDHQNGTYEAIALLMEPGNYMVRVILDYTLCDGLRDPPKNWFKLGEYFDMYSKCQIVHECLMSLYNY